MLKTAKIEILGGNLKSWDALCKKANKSVSAEESKKEAVEKEADFQVVATIDPEKFIYIHTTIMAGVKTEENGFNITAESEKFINDNHDAWTCDDLLKDYKSFKRATTFVEHDQRLENAKGKCIDVIARDMGDTILIDVLFSVDKRHKDLVANIENGIINAVSMGCTTAQTICSICGNVANDPTTYCDHLKRGNKGSTFTLSDGSKRRSAEICKNNTFFDVSLVANPAFAGAVFRKILSSSEVSNHLLANILNSKIEAMYKDDGLVLKAASKNNDVANISIKEDGSIEINTSNQALKQTFKASEVLSKDEIESICAFVPQQKSSFSLESIFEKMFGKKQATHPIQNESGNKDFSISDHDYTDIPYSNPHDIKDEAGLEDTKTTYLELKPQQPIVILEIKPTSSTFVASRVDEFECIKCGFKSDLWKVKASTIDAGQISVLECPRCFYSAEESLYKTASKIKAKPKDKVEINKGKEKGQKGVIVSLRGPLAIVKLENGKTVWKTPNDLDIEKIETKKSSIFVVSQDIPVENDEGTYWFDEQGNSVITKGEKVTFIASVDNGEYGLFITETGEDFYMPLSYVNKRKS